MRRVGRWTMIAAVVIYLLALLFAVEPWAQSWDVFGGTLLLIGFPLWLFGVLRQRRERRLERNREVDPAWKAPHWSDRP